MKSILDRGFTYHSSVDTDLRRTFARVRRQMRRAAVDAQKPQQPARLASIFSAPGRTSR